jgi:hypothetical protein
MSKLIVNCETGEEIVTDLSKADKDQHKIDEAQSAVAKAALEAKAQAKAVLLDRLGITAEEAVLLLS